MQLHVEADQQAFSAAKLSTSNLHYPIFNVPGFCVMGFNIPPTSTIVETAPRFRASST